MFENPRRCRQARNFTTNVPKTLDLTNRLPNRHFPKIEVGCPWNLKKKLIGTESNWSFWKLSVISQPTSFQRSFFLSVTFDVMLVDKFVDMKQWILLFASNFFAYAKRIKTCNRPLHGCEGMQGNQDKTAGKSKVCMGIQSELILPNWRYSSLSLCKLFKTNEFKETVH